MNRSQKACIGLIVLLFGTTKGASGQDDIRAWEGRCLEKILKNYNGPELNDKSAVSIDFTMFSDGTVKWPHAGRRQLYSQQKSESELSPLQHQTIDALEKAVVKASPLEKYPPEYFLKRGVGAIFLNESKPCFCLNDYPGSWTYSIYSSSKPTNWPEVLNPVVKTFVEPSHKREVHACIYLVIDPDGKPLNIDPTRCTRIKPGIKESYAEIKTAQQALVKAVKNCGKFSVTRLYGQEPKPVAAYLVYRSYQKPALALYTAFYGRRVDYIDLYENGQTAPKIEN